MSVERSQQPQMSDWSTPTVNEPPAKENRVRRIPALLGGLLLGALLVGVVLAVIISLWLTPSGRTTVGSTISLSSNATNSLSSTMNATRSTSSSTTVVTSIITTTGSTPSSSTTTARTISTTITSTTALTLPVMTYPTQIAVTSTVARTVTSTSCTAPTSTPLYSSPGPRLYTFVTYSYTALSSGTGYVEFGFSNPSSSYAWCLDDVSLQDINASNMEMLTNGDFETRTLTGWEVACTSSCLSLTGGDISNKDYHTGSFCYVGACVNYYDFLRQTFPKTIGHVYNLTFWYKSSGRNNQEAFVNIL